MVVSKLEASIDLSTTFVSIKSFNTFKTYQTRRKPTEILFSIINCLANLKLLVAIRINCPSRAIVNDGGRQIDLFKAIIFMIFEEKKLHET